MGENLPKIAVGSGYFYHSILDKGYGFGALYATVAIPISNWWGGSHAMRRSKLNADMARNQLHDASVLLEVNMINAWNALTGSYDKMLWHASLFTKRTKICILMRIIIMSALSL